MNKGKGQDLWNKAKTIIPGGNMLLSKRAEMFLPENWPSYFEKAKGCYVWDLDGEKLLDMSIMGIGTNLLGYGQEDIDKAVMKTIKAGNMSTLNCQEEVHLAEELIALHPWADMARFARSGGEANAIAIRIARAAAGKDKIAICGYHGWHDWYLATNIENNSGLNEHLLPGLSPKGVPNALIGTSIPFRYNNYTELEFIAENNDLAAIKMEVQRSEPPKDNFLQKVRALCDRKNIILIFDECTSGFRECLGGLHLKHQVNPDMAMFGKALGNGYAITAIIGKESIMQAAQTSFISSTFWTERIGPTAALKTIQIMKDIRSWEDVSCKGEFIKELWLKIAKKYNLEIEIGGIKAIPHFTIKSQNFLKYKTLITQEMLKNNILASNIIFLSTAHQHEQIEFYANTLDRIFSVISECEHNCLEIDSLLEGPVCHSGFKRLT